MAVRLLALLAGAALGVVTLVTSGSGPGYSFARTGTGGTTLLMLAGWTPMGAAALLPRRRRTTAVLVALAGAAWFLTEWDNPGASALVFTVGLVAGGVAPVVVMHAASAYSGSTWASRLVVTTGYAVLLGLQGVAPALWFRPDPASCGCPDNLISVGGDPARVAELGRMGVWAGLAWACAAVALLAWRLFSASTARLRASGAVTAAGLAYVGLAAAYHLHSLEWGLLGSDAFDRRLWLLQGLVLTALGAAVAADLVRSRQARRALTSVVTGLREGDASDLRARIAAMLRDPDLEIAYPVDDGNRYVDDHGAPLDLTALPDRQRTPVRRGATELAVLLHRSGLDAGEVDGLVSAVHLALDHKRLGAEALAQLADLRASGSRIVAAGDDERRRLERDLHDGAQQHLVALLLHLNLLQSRASGNLSDLGAQGLAAATNAVAAALDQLRSAARQLTPVLLDSAGLPAALGALAETRPLTIEAVPPYALPQLVEATVYLLAEHVSRGGPVAIAVSASPEQVSVILRAQTPIDLGELADRVTALDGQSISGAGADADVSDGWHVTVVTLPLMTVATHP